MRRVSRKCKDQFKRVLFLEEFFFSRTCKKKKLQRASGATTGLWFFSSAYVKADASRRGGGGPIDGPPLEPIGILLSWLMSYGCQGGSNPGPMMLRGARLLLDYCGNSRRRHLFVKKIIIVFCQIFRYVIVSTIWFCISSNRIVPAGIETKNKVVQNP